MTPAPTELTNCPDCGHALTQEGLCARCLLRLGRNAGGNEGAVLEPTRLHAGAGSSGPGSGVKGQTTLTPAELTSMFPQYEIMNMVGRGGMGTVYRARQKSLDRMVAIKTIVDVDEDPSFAERFTREARALARLSHPNIVTVHDFGRVESLFFLVMEFVDGVNLRQAIDAKAFDSSDALRMVEQVCQALQYAHSRGVVHRDIKPENIMLTEDGTAKIADFGLAKLMDDVRPSVTLTATRQVMGTLAYMAPEQMDNSANVDHRADIYSLGVVFYELLTGHLPLGRFEPPSHSAQGIDLRVDPVVMKTLSRQPADRYQAASDLGSEVARIQSDPNIQRQSPEYVAQIVAEEIPAIPIAQPLPASYAPQKPPEARAAASALPGRKLEQTESPVMSMPFKLKQMYGGFAEGRGMLHLNDDEVRFEWMVKDSMFGLFQSDMHHLRIPLQNITRMQLKDYAVAVRLRICTGSMTGLDPLPQEEPGTVKLAISRSDASDLRAWLQRQESLRPLGSNEGVFREAARAIGLNQVAVAAPPTPHVVPLTGEASKKFTAWGFTTRFVVFPIAIVLLLIVVKFTKTDWSPSLVQITLEPPRVASNTVVLKGKLDGKNEALFHFPLADLEIASWQSDRKELATFRWKGASQQRAMQWMKTQKFDDQTTLQLSFNNNQMVVDVNPALASGVLHMVPGSSTKTAGEVRQLLEEWVTTAPQSDAESATQ